MKLVIVGSVAVDTLSTPHGSVRRALGGAATHASVAASFFTPDLGLVGVVGDDFPERFPALLRSRRINLEGLSRVEGRTFHWKGRYRGDMAVAETLKTELGVFADFDPRLPPSYKSAPYLFLGNIVPEIQHRVLAQMKRPRFSMLDTMNLWIATKKPALMKVVRKVDALVVNDMELRQLTGIHSLIRAARWLVGRGPRWIFLKRGEHGASLVGRTEYFHLPAYPTDRVKDPTGAGDSFAGGVMGSLASSGRADFASLKTAMACGVALSSFQVEDFSLWRTVKLKRREINARLAALRRMTSF